RSANEYRRRVFRLVGGALLSCARPPRRASPRRAAGAPPARGRTPSAPPGGRARHHRPPPPCVPPAPAPGRRPPCPAAVHAADPRPGPGALLHERPVRDPAGRGPGRTRHGARGGRGAPTRSGVSTRPRAPSHGRRAGPHARVPPRLRRTRGDARPGETRLVGV